MLANQAQEEAINTIYGPLMIVACPGSGKTTTLIRRIRHMEEEGIEPGSILMMTFTKAAAEEMKERYKKMYDEETTVTFCTMHSLCLAILKKFSTEEWDLISESEIKDFFRKKTKKETTIKDGEAFLKDLLLDVGIVKNNQIDPKTYKPKCTSNRKLFLKLYEDYEKYKEENGLIDFDDMLVKSLTLLKEDENALAWLQQKFQYIQVDEYQDTNEVQKEITYLIAGDKENLAIVGDDDQSIYGFRGARPEIMLNFKKDFPDAKVIEMGTNYRSVPQVITASDSVIKKNKKRFPKRFTAGRSDDGKVTMIKTGEREEEIKYVTASIYQRIKAGCDPDDIAVLYRTNRQATDIALSLIKAGIPFQTREVLQSSYQHWIYNDIIAYHNLAAGKFKPRDLRTAINHPNRYLGREFIDCGLDERKMMNIASMQYSKQMWQIQKTKDEIQEFFILLAVMKDRDPESMIKALRSLTSYDQFLSESASFRNESPDELKSILNFYEKDSHGLNWGQWARKKFLHEKSLKDNQNNKKGVMLSTLHRSKGLEWKNVYILDCVEGKIPYSKAESPEDYEEERRLFYVGMTRAKDHLTICTYENDGNSSVKRSRFLPCGQKKVKNNKK